MVTPTDAAKGLGRAKRLHIEHGIAGAPRSMLDALERRGIVQESERKPGYLELSPVGLCVRTIVMGGDHMTDAERIEMRTPSGGSFLGPAEWEGCDRHPGHGSVYRWVWDEPGDGDHVSAIESASEPHCLASCPLCYPPDDGTEDM